MTNPYPANSPEWMLYEIFSGGTKPGLGQRCPRRHLGGRMSIPADAAKSWLENADRMHRDYGVPLPVNYQLVTELVAELETVRLEADLLNLSVTNRSIRPIAAVQHHLHMSRSNHPPRQPGSHVYNAERGTIRRYA